MVSCTNTKKEKGVTVRGKILSGQIEEVRFEWIVDNPIRGNGAQYIAEVDSTSQFSVKIPVEKPATGRIKVGGFYHEMYLLPGDDFYVEIDGDVIRCIYPGRVMF